MQLLISMYIHNILPPSSLCLGLSLIMPCILVHMSVFFGNVYKMQPSALHICKLKCQNYSIYRSTIEELLFFILTNWIDICNCI